MTTNFIRSIQQSADNIIDMSVLLKDRMESWADVFARFPDSHNVNISAGFVTNRTRPNVMELLVEVQAPKDDTSALVRVQAIEIVQSTAGDERYNQVSLHFAVGPGQARQLVKKGPSITRGDIAELLRAEDSRLVMVSVSDEAGTDSVTGQLSGKRQELDQNELAGMFTETEDELLLTIQAVVTKLEKTAQQEAIASQFNLMLR